MSILSPRILVYWNPLTCASKTPLKRFWATLGRMYKSFNLGLPFPWLMINLSCFTKSAFSFSSVSRVLYFFWMSLMSLKAVFKFALGAWISPGSLTFVLRYVLKNEWALKHACYKKSISSKSSLLTVPWEIALLEWWHIRIHPCPLKLPDGKNWFANRCSRPQRK